jgi:hypothetical protein
MTLKEIAELATGLSLIVASITLIYTLIDRNLRERRSEIQKWQRLVIFRQIDGFAKDFNTIKRDYINAAVQSVLPIPKSVIQDDELQLALLSLVEAKLVAIRADGTYVAIRMSEAEDEMRRIMLIQINKREVMSRLGSKILVVLEKDSGRFTQDELMRELGEDAALIDYLDYNMLLTNMRRTGDIVIVESKVWLRSKLPSTTVKPGASQSAAP